jgi:two-component system cell cycle sensor histidine kinase/response regulator CckA
MNLLGNAMEALKDKGSIVISTENIHLEKPFLAYETIAEGNYIKITISDDGAGISQNDLERIFEPFYSKKVMGRSGTGLGLAIVWNRVHEHDGFINVISGASGTSFEIYIPSTTEAKTIDNPVASLKTLKGNGEVILVVDDEMIQCLTASNLLKNLGYTPIYATKGEEAVEMCNNTSVDVVLLDMVLGHGINGSQIYEKMLYNNQRQKAIVVSGFAEEDEIAKIRNLGVSHFVKKPYTVNQHAIAVKHALGSSSGIL